MADDCVIRVTGLKKSFPKGKEVLHVLKGIDMEIRPGEVIGYLGSNGAGKSTTVKIMCGLLEDFEGKVDVLGYDVRENDIEVKKRIGYIPENAVMYEHLTPMEYLEFIGAMYGLDQKEVNRKADELLSLFEMRENRDVRMVNFSKGMKQKVHIISGLLHNPEVIFMDEPLNGLDANAVISTSSSSLMNSTALSSVSCTGGTRRIASSVPEARMLVSCLQRMGFTTMSFSRECSPMIMPS